MTRARRNMASAGALLLIIVSAFFLAAQKGHGSDFNPDESRWLSRAHYLADLADPAGATWNDRYMTRGQPPLGSYATGLGLVIQGRDLKTNPPWDFSLPWEVNVAIGNKPAAADLAAGRNFSAFLTAITALIVIAVASTFISAPWAIGAGALYAIHPYSSYIGSIATADALFGVLIAAAALAAAKLGRRPTWLRALLLGGLLGLGAAAKLSPLVVAAGVSCGIIAVVVTSSIRRGQLLPGDVKWSAYSVLIGTAAIATFIAVYPYLWPDPMTRTLNLYSFRAGEMAAQAADWPVMAVPNRADALRRTYANFSDGYNLSTALMQRTSSAQAPFALRQVEILAAVTGLVVLAAIAVRAGPLSPQSLAIMVLGGHVLVTVLGMRSEFDRYHLPMFILGVIAVAAALDWCVHLRRGSGRHGSESRSSKWRGIALRA